jgi:hypothetical protein
MRHLTLESSQIDSIDRIGENLTLPSEKNASSHSCLEHDDGWFVGAVEWKKTGLGSTPNRHFFWYK